MNTGQRQSHRLDEHPGHGTAQRDELVAELAPRGVAEGYFDTEGRYRHTPTETLARIKERFGAEFDGDPVPLVCTPGRYHPELYGTMVLEDGHTYRAAGFVNLIGYHILYTDDCKRRLVICAPEALPTPPRAWGWQVQLYAARTEDSWGIGDFRDLAHVCRIAAAQGAGCVQVSPVHALAPISSPQDSPYSPASRNFLNLLYVAPGVVPGAELVDLSDLVVQGRALNADRTINRAAVWKLKRAALERIWTEVRDDLPWEYHYWRDEQGTELTSFAVWSALAEQFDAPDWRTWPSEYRRPDAAGIADYTSEHADRIEFFAWCEWVAQLQYQQACSCGVDVMADLAVGFDANSEDAWAFQDLLCCDFEIGAPPDAHNTAGQRWGLPPFHPLRLMRADFRPQIQMVDAALRYAGALRIDHVMQLWRLYWIPVAAPSADGAYVYYNVDALLAILRVEAERRHAWIVGEDMGTVAEGVRETMAGIGMLGYRSALRTPNSELPDLSVVTASTHDQVTIVGLLTGSDVAELRRIGQDADFDQIEVSRVELTRLAGLNPDKPGAELTTTELRAAVRARYRELAKSPSRVALISLEDAALVSERPNVPGTVHTYPNWRLALPRPVDEILFSDVANDLVLLMNEHR